MKIYTVRTGCEIAGVWREAGAGVAMTEAQAKELQPPLGNVLLPDAPSEGTPNDKLDRNRRRHRRRDR